jgi:hypothetical protein
MRTLFLALATSAVVFSTGVTPAAAADYLYCIQGDDFAGGAGDCSFSTYAQCQATASGRLAYCGVNRAVTANALMAERGPLALSAPKSSVRRIRH